MRASRCTRCSSPSPTTEKRTDLDQSARPDRRPPSVAARQPPPAAQGERSRSAPFTPSGSFPRRRGKRRRPPQSLARQLSPLRRGSEIPSPAERDRARPSGRARVAEGLPSITSPASGGSGAHNPSPAAAGEGGRRPEGGAFGIAARIRLDRSAHPLHPSGELPPQAGEAKQKRPLGRCATAPPAAQGERNQSLPPRSGIERGPQAGRGWPKASIQSLPPHRRGKVAGGRKGALLASPRGCASTAALVPFTPPGSFPRKRGKRRRPLSRCATAPPAAQGERNPFGVVAGGGVRAWRWRTTSPRGRRRHRPCLRAASGRRGSPRRRRGGRAMR